MLILKFCITKRKAFTLYFWKHTAYPLLMKEMSFSFLLRIPSIKCRNGKSPFFNPKRIIDSGQYQQWMLKPFGEKVVGNPAG